MKSKSGLLLVAAAIAVLAVSMLRSGDRATDEAVDRAPETTAHSGTAARDLAPPVHAEADDPESPVPENASMDLEQGGNRNLEQSLIHADSLDAARAGELADYELFAALVAELQRDTSAIAAEKRRSYQLFFYSRAAIRSGSIFLDVLECGTRICVAEFRARDQDALGNFTHRLYTSKDFGGGATFDLVTPDVTGASAETRRILFSHDPALNSVFVQTPASVSPGSPPDIH